MNLDEEQTWKEVVEKYDEKIKNLHEQIMMQERKDKNLRLDLSDCLQLFPATDNADDYESPSWPMIFFRIGELYNQARIITDQIDKSSEITIKKIEELKDLGKANGKI